MAKKIVKMMDIVPGGRGVSREREEDEAKTKENTDSLILKDAKKVKKEPIQAREEKSQRPPRKINIARFIKRAGIFIFIIVALAGIFYAMFYVLPKAEISISSKKSEWKFNGTIESNKSLNDINAQTKQIPGELIKQTKNIALQFTASGEKDVMQKAQGTITVVNAYSSSPQVFVSGTRFESPDGKIFRATEKLSIPGANVVNGKIEPSKISVKAVADKAGPDYNIKPVEKFTIPGLKGSDKFNGFYGYSEKNMTGGLIGKAPYPTDDDIKKASDETEKSVKNLLIASLFSGVPNNLKILPDSYSIKITKKNIDTQVNDEKKFSVFIEGEIYAVLFNEDDAFSVLSQNAFKELNLNDSEFKQGSFDLKYGTSTIDIKNGKMTIPVKYETVLSRIINERELKAGIVGKKEIEARAYLVSFPGIDKVSASLWPFWINKVPEKESRIKINIQ